MISGTPGLNLRPADRKSGAGSKRAYASSCENVGQSAGRKCDSDSERRTVWPRFQANCWYVDVGTMFFPKMPIWSGLKPRYSAET